MIAKASVRAFAAVFLLNFLFLFLAFYSASMPSERAASAVRRAFETGAFSDAIDRGFNEYNDCIIIHLIVNRVSLFDDALAPLWKGNTGDPCATLRNIVVDGTTDLKGFGYTRYWHGTVPIAKLFLSVSDLDLTWTVLRFLVYLSCLTLGISALFAPIEAKIFACSVAVMAVLFWAVSYFGQSLAHAPGDAFLMLGLAGFLFFSDRMSVRRALVPYSAAYGAGVAYLEFWTGQLPTAAGFLFVAAYLVAVAYRADSERLIVAWVAAGASVLAFLAGAGFTVASKQALAMMFTDAPALSMFSHNLIFYSGLSHSTQAGIWGRLSGFLELLRHSATLTRWSETGALGLRIGVIGAWCGAGLLAWYRRSEGPRPISDLLAFATGSSVAFIWAVLFFVHTAVHAVYMSRILILPVALGATAFLCEAAGCIAALARPRNLQAAARHP
jgi:hypothetical protein